VTLTHFRGIIVPPGYVNELNFADGNPYGVSHITGPDNKALVNDSTTAALDHLVQRVVAVAGRIASEHSRSAAAPASSPGRTPRAGSGGR
jgi:NAD(P)H dehydrogenase (quinone)